MKLQKDRSGSDDKELMDVCFFTNGMIMSFDDEGRQMPECQGFILDGMTIAEILIRSTKETHFYFVDWKRKSVKTYPCDFKWWFEKRESEDGSESPL